MLSKVKAALLAMQRYSWEQGVCAQAFLESGEYDTVIQLCYDAVNRQTEDGRLANIGYQHGVTDPVAIVPSLIKACEITGDPVLKSALDKVRHWVSCGAPRNGDGVIYHMDDTRQFWVDTLYMLPPAMYSLGYADEAVFQASAHIDALWDKDMRLFRHIWDDESRKFANPAFWGVGNGWAISGLSRLIEVMPESGERARYIDVVQKTTEAALALSDGNLFHNYLDRTDSFLECNFAQMLCYTVSKGVKQGWLPDRLLEPAKQIRQTVHRHVCSYGFVRDVCGAPFFNSSGIAPEAQAFFILMESVF